MIEITSLLCSAREAWIPLVGDFQWKEYRENKDINRKGSIYFEICHEGRYRDISNYVYPLSHCNRVEYFWTCPKVRVLINYLGVYFFWMQCMQLELGKIRELQPQTSQCTYQAKLFVSWIKLKMLNSGAPFQYCLPDLKYWSFLFA